MWFIAGAALLGVAGLIAVKQGVLAPPGGVVPARAQAERAAARPVPVEVAPAVKKPVPLTLDALGTVTPLASVAIKSRLDTEVLAVHFEDGAAVAKGDLLFTLDGRSLEAQIRQAEGLLARDRAQLEGAERDLRRYRDLLARNVGTGVNVENATTQVGMLTGTVKADESALQNLRVQHGYTKIYAPISGRISAANAKAGNFVRPADTAAMATVNQTKPVYVTFGIPQRSLAQIRQAMAAGSARVEASIAGQDAPSIGRLAMIDNAVDAGTGMIPVRAVIDNQDEALWPGALVNVQLILRTEEVVAVPSVAIQSGQSGTFVFVVKDGAAQVQPVTVARTAGGDTVLGEGLAGGETVVIDGQLLLTHGTKVAPRPPARAPAGT